MMTDKGKSGEGDYLDEDSMQLDSPNLDQYLEDTLAEYDSWMREGTISYSSRVIPVKESFEADQWILPSGQVLSILQEARSIAVQNCVCRSRYQRCDHPVDVCFVLNEISDKYVAEGAARRVSLPEAAEILIKANQAGLVHLSLYMPDHEIYALCSCCSCCCHDFQLVKTLGRKDLMVRSEYIAVTERDLCTVCGDCVDRCVFEARTLFDHQLEFTPEKCMGCGLCISVCDDKAIRMVALDDQSIVS